MMRFPVDRVKNRLLRSVIHEFCRDILDVLGRFTFGLHMRCCRKVLAVAARFSGWA
jgi:hypothetical protein